MKKYLKSNNFDTIYKKILLGCYKDYEFIYESRGRKAFEITNISFTLENPENNKVSSKKRGFKEEFAQKFFEWVRDGEDDISKLFKFNKNAKNYDNENKGRNTAYGPRIKGQEKYILDELTRDNGSRRAVIHILYEGDHEMLKDSFDGKIKTEYPCTFQLMFLIRNNKLDLHVGMRSNNILKTICYDVYNFTNMQKHFLNLLKEKGLDLKLGQYHQQIVSAHFFEDEKPLVEVILKEYNLI